jgi:cytochrome c oxidase cbb3-type subunit 3
MSSFWSAFITILTIANILGCIWLIWWVSKPAKNEAAKGEATGHTWDDTLSELNNPMPRWWLWMFYISIIFGLIYLVLYPGLGNFKGVLNWTQTGEYDAEISRANASYGKIFAAYANTDIPTLAKDTKAMQAGQRLFLNYCSTCHGSDAGGAFGFPNLTDNDWLYDGTPEAIQETITNGRSGVMPALGAGLGEQGVKEVVEFLVSINKRDANVEQAAKGKALFSVNCAPCHQPDATGNTLIGAPNLTNNTWLYGGSKGVITKTIMNGRNGKMPAHGEFLGKDKIHLLTAYIYSLRQ